MKIKILTDTHEHQGEPVKPGTILEVDETTGKHLVAISAAEPAPTKTKE